METRPANDKKLFIKFRPFFVFIVLVLTFVSCFLAYMLDANDNEDKYIAKWEKINVEKIDSKKDVAVSDVINPVPLSERKDGTYIKQCVFVGGAAAEDMKNYFGKSEDGAFYYAFFDPNTTINSENFAKLNIADSEQVYICVALPIAPAAENAKLSNKNIDKFNSELLEFSNKNNFNFLDLNTVLKGDDGKLSPEYIGDDNALNEKGYEIIREYILTHTAT